MSSRCPATPANSSGKCRSPKSNMSTGLSPAISIEQKTTSKSPRSTVGTVTEVYDYLRILYARLGHRLLSEIVAIADRHADMLTRSSTKILDACRKGTNLYLMAPRRTAWGRRSTRAVWDEIRRAGFVRMRVDGQVVQRGRAARAIDHRRKHQRGSRSWIAWWCEPTTRTPGGRRRGSRRSIWAAGVLHVAHVDADSRDEPRVEGRAVPIRSTLPATAAACSFEPLNPHQLLVQQPARLVPDLRGTWACRSGASACTADPRHRVARCGHGALAAWPPLRPRTTRFCNSPRPSRRHAGFSLDTPFDGAGANSAACPSCKAPAKPGWIWRAAGVSPLFVSGKNKNSRLTPAARQPKFQYKGLFPAIDEASRVSHGCIAQKLDHLVNEVPCSTCGGARVCATTRRRRGSQGHTLGDAVRDLPLGRDAQALFRRS